ncbi:tail protein (putative endopeptidase) [Cytobacillus horneckiae]|uniref:phage tail protein n=1 Tax=Cytobacillus horneckiae TaxID=549687 RepID=UPI0019D31D3E|nr:phage tail protein [Cytobacillus horneckiae]MBN6889895.1 phage tail protein [Cytobacillus horneckiae]
MLEIKDLFGSVEPLDGWAELNRKRKVNGERTLKFIIFPTEKNIHGFNMVETESQLTFDGEVYVIKKVVKKSIGNSFYKEVTAIHKFYVDMINKQQPKIHNGSLTFINALNMIFVDMPYTYVVTGSFSARSFENFGNDNRLSLLQKVLERYRVEMEVRGSIVYFRKIVGNDTDFQFRYKHNIINLDNDDDSMDLATVISGTGAEGISAYYRSPNADIFGELDAPPVEDERFTSQETLLEEMKARLQDAPVITITINFADLRASGYPYTVPSEGDRIFIIYEPMDDFELETRILEIDETFKENPNPNENPIAIRTDVVLSNHKKSFAGTTFDQIQKSLSKIVNDDGTIKYDFLDEAVKQATEALKSAQTELEFSNGIIAREKDNPNKLVLFNSAGIGISTDGGSTFNTAMTADGFVADYIAAGTLRGILIEGVDIRGSTITSAISDTVYTTIAGATLESRGIHTRTWLGETTTHDVALRLQRGYFRARNNSLNRSLYFADTGISTFIDGEGEEGGSSGSLIWWDTRYSPSGANGFTINSHGGVVALESNLNRIVLNAELSVNVESRQGPVYLRPYRNGRPGNNVFNFTLSDGNTASDIDGFSMYGSDINGYSVGLRYSKSGGTPTISMVDGNYNRGGNTTFDVGNLLVNNIRKRNGSGTPYWNGSGTGTTAGGTLENTLFATAMRTNDSNIYLATDQGGAVHATDYAGYNNGNGITHRPMVATEFTPSSSVRYKDNIQLFEESGLEIVKDHQIYTYFLKSDLKAGIYDNQQIGFLAEAAPMLRKGDTISLNKSVSVAWKAIQELIDEVDLLKQKIIDLEMAV